MIKIPNHLLANEERVSIIKENQCENCILLRRTDLNFTVTPGGELGADIWASKEIFGLSVNIFLCNTASLPIESYKDDVNYIVKQGTDEPFTSNQQLKKYDFSKVLVEKLEKKIVLFKIKEILNISGSYPFKKGTPDEESYDYKLRLSYCPNVLNNFHFQLEVYSNQSGDWSKIDRKNSKKSYIRSLATEIRAKILKEKKVKELVI